MRLLLAPDLSLIDYLYPNVKHSKVQFISNRIKCDVSTYKNLERKLGQIKNISKYLHVQNLP